MHAKKISNSAIKERVLRNCRWLGPPLLLSCLAVGFLGRCVAQEQQLPVSITPQQQSGVTTLAQMVQKELMKEKCSGTSCEILVVNFSLPSGDTCSACILLSDSVARALRELPAAPSVISRASFSSYVDQERIPSQLLNQREILGGIARQFHTSRVLFGTIKPEANFLLLKTQLLNGERSVSGTHVSKEMSVKILSSNLAAGLNSREAFDALPKRGASRVDAEAANVSEFARQGITPPHCTYMPNPVYTQAARAAKLSGALVVEAIITAQGTVTEPRISRGLPFGLNQNSLETLKTWKCEPATKNGVPVAVLLPFEVSFRLY
jgi:TonB family protein